MYYEFHYAIYFFKRKDDSFYSSLAATAAKSQDAMSDVSDADPDEMMKSMGNLDDLDAMFLGGLLNILFIPDV